MFPGNVFDTPRIRNQAIYAQDWFWGGVLVVAALLFIAMPKHRYFKLRRWLHIFSWVFWFSITVLLASRTFVDGVAPTDFLFISVFTAIAFCHLTLYNRLAGIR